jgi:hypothetical protein
MLMFGPWFDEALSKHSVGMVVHFSVLGISGVPMLGPWFDVAPSKRSVGTALHFWSFQRPVPLVVALFFCPRTLAGQPCWSGGSLAPLAGLVDSDRLLAAVCLNRGQSIQFAFTWALRCLFGSSGAHRRWLSLGFSGLAAIFLDGSTQSIRLSIVAFYSTVLRRPCTAASLWLQVFGPPNLPAQLGARVHSRSSGRCSPVQ